MFLNSSSSIRDLKSSFCDRLPMNGRASFSLPSKGESASGLASSSRSTIWTIKLLATRACNSCMMKDHHMHINSPQKHANVYPESSRPDVTHLQNILFQRILILSGFFMHLLGKESIDVSSSKVIFCVCGCCLHSSDASWARKQIEILCRTMNSMW